LLKKWSQKKSWGPVPPYLCFNGAAADRLRKYQLPRANPPRFRPSRKPRVSAPNWRKNSGVLPKQRYTIRPHLGKEPTSPKHKKRINRHRLGPISHVWCWDETALKMTSVPRDKKKQYPKLIDFENTLIAFKMSE
jgi:hypothetical protein